MSQLLILPDNCKSSDFKRGSLWQRLLIPFVSTKSSTPKCLPVKIKNSKELIVSHHTFHRGTGEKYIKLLENFKSIVHKKVLHTLFQKLDTNHKARQTELDLHRDTNPDTQDCKNPADDTDVNPSAGLGISQGTKKLQGSYQVRKEVHGRSNQD